MIEKNKLIKYLIIGFLFFLTVKVLSITSDIKEKNYQFNGVIEKIDYNENKHPQLQSMVSLMVCLQVGDLTRKWMWVIL